MSSGAFFSTFAPRFFTVAEVTGGTPSNDLSNLGTVFTQITSWVQSIVTTITASPVLMIGLGIFVVGGVIGLGYRLIRG